jgi:hypothetical protein
LNVKESSLAIDALNAIFLMKKEKAKVFFTEMDEVFEGKEGLKILIIDLNEIFDFLCQQRKTITEYTSKTKNAAFEWKTFTTLEMEAEF